MAGVEPIVAVWPAPARVRAMVTTRFGGASDGRYASFNLAAHCGDDPARVTENRERLRAHLGVPPICWLNQVHGVEVADAAVDYPAPPDADAALCRSAGRACAILTADCLPVLICDRAGSVVAAAHCGWRGLAHGVLTRLVGRLAMSGHELMAWLGPAIGPTRYEVGDDVRRALLDRVSVTAVDAALRAGREPGKWWADLYELARCELRTLGVTDIYGGDFCTFRETRFYSFRRDGVTGRMAALIWLADGA